MPNLRLCTENPENKLSKIKQKADKLKIKIEISWFEYTSNGFKTFLRLFKRLYNLARFSGSSEFNLLLQLLL